MDLYWVTGAAMISSFRSVSFNHPIKKHSINLSHIRLEAEAKPNKKKYNEYKWNIQFDLVPISK